jgi:hypothetical protein
MVMENADDTETLSCGHSFHRECIGRWFKQKYRDDNNRWQLHDECPMCRGKDQREF